MLKRISKTIYYYIGAILALFFKLNNKFVHAQTDISLYGIQPVYGINISPPKEPTLLEKIYSVIFSPVFIALFFILAFIAGIIAYTTQQRKNAKEISKILSKK